MNRTLALALAGVTTTTVLIAAGCTRQDPCATLPPPSQSELAIAAQGAEIEREVDDTECELKDGRWVADDDSRAHSKPSTRPSTKTSTRAKSGSSR